MIQYKLCEYSVTGVHGYVFMTEGEEVGRCLTSVMSSPCPAFIHSKNYDLISEFDSGSTIVPGLVREIRDQTSGAVVVKMIYRGRGEYEIINDGRSITGQSECEDYMFYESDATIARLTRQSNGKTITVDWGDLTESFLAVAGSKLSEVLLITILSFPMLRFAF